MMTLVVDDQTWNSAQRLLWLVDQLYKQSKAAPREPLRRLIHQARDLGDLREDPRDLLRFLAAVGELPDQILAALESIDSPFLEAVRPDIERLRHAFTVDELPKQWAHLSEDWLNPGTIARLQTASIELARSGTWQEHPVSETLLEALTALVREARDGLIEDTEVDPEVRRYLLRALFDMERAVGAYQTDGIGGFRKEYDAIIGRYATDERLHAKQPWWESKTLRKVRTVFSAVALVIGFATDAVTLTGNELPWTVADAPPEFQAIIPEGLALPPGSMGELEAGSQVEEVTVEADGHDSSPSSQSKTS